MVLLCDGPVTEASHLIKKDENRSDDERKPRSENAESSEDDSDEAQPDTAASAN